MIASRAEAERPESDLVRSLYERLAWPAVALLIVGLTLHNLLVLGLVDLGINVRAVKVLSAWKEALIAALLIAGLAVYRDRLRRLNLIDLLVLVFVLLNLLYLVGSPGGLIQKLYGVRLNCMFCAAYGLGRLLPVDPHGATRALIALLLAVTGAALIGLLEVFIVPTRAWVDLGLPQYTNSLGFHYTGPYGLPENLFVNLGVLIRRAISVYLSPLALALSVVLVLPVALWSVDRRQSPGQLWWAAATLALVAGLAVTLTRSAILVAVVVLIATSMLAIRRRAIAVFGGVLAIALLIFIFTPLSASLTPAVDLYLNPIPRSGLEGAGTHLITGRDDSLTEHFGAQRIGLKVLASHPLGIGIGQSGSIAVRFGSEGRPGEDTYLQLGTELGWIGLALALGLHLAVFLTLVRQRRQFLEANDPLAGYWLVVLFGGAAIFALQAQSDILGDFPVVIPLWIAIGWFLTATSSKAFVPRR